MKTRHAATLLIAVSLAGCGRDDALPACSGDACSSHVDLNGFGGDSSAGRLMDSGAPDLVTGDLAIACSQIDGPVHPYSSKGEQLSLVLGRWRRCSGNPIGKTDTFGLEFTQDGHWYSLTVDGGGNVTRAAGGFDSLGTFTDFDGGQFNITFVDGGTRYFFVAFEDGPRKMRMTGMTPPDASYVAF